MKKMISLFSVALLATVFAAGCGGGLHKDCSDAPKDKASECAKDKFEKDKFEGKCGWLPTTADAAKGECKKVADVESALNTACTSTTAPATNDDAGCKAKLGNQKDATGTSKTCKWDTGTTKCKFE